VLVSISYDKVTKRKKEPIQDSLSL